MRQHTRNGESMTTLVRGAAGSVGVHLAADRVNAGSVWRRIRFLLGHEAFRKSPITYSRRLIAWKAHCLLRTSAVVRMPEFGIKLFVPPVWRGTAKTIYVFRAAYEPELHVLTRFVSSGHVFVDVGANYGIYTAIASRLAGPAGRVISFEPATRAYAVLERNVGIGQMKNVSTFRLALSNQRGEMVLRVRDDPSMNAIARAPHTGEVFEPIRTSTLDVELVRENIRRVHMVKLDVEGAEELVLRGGASTLRTSRPVVLFEINAEAARALDLRPEGAWEMLREYGYRFFQLDRRRRMVEMKTVLAGGNVVGIHRSSSLLAREARLCDTMAVHASAAREEAGEAHDG
jgi:FkbM family methyltransferase